jgi:hypothetical protein
VDAARFHVPEDFFEVTTSDVRAVMQTAAQVMNAQRQRETETERHRGREAEDPSSSRVETDRVSFSLLFGVLQKNVMMTEDKEG